MKRLFAMFLLLLFVSPANAQSCNPDTLLEIKKRLNEIEELVDAALQTDNIIQDDLVPNEHNPIVMVHGALGYPQNYNDVIKSLVQNGYKREELYAIEIPDNSLLCSENHVLAIETIVGQLLATGYEKIDLIGYSRGGKNVWDFMLASPLADSIANVILVAGIPHYGGIAGSCRLTPEDQTPGDALYTSIYSPDDSVVLVEWSILDGANNIAIDGVFHLSALYDNRVINEIIKALNGTGLNN